MPARKSGVLRARRVVGVLLPLLALAGFRSDLSTGSPRRSSSIALTPDGRLLVVANPDSGSVSLLALPSLEVLAEIPAGRNPQSVAVDQAGSLAYVTARDDGAVSVIGLASRRRLATLPAGNEPRGVVVGPEGRVYVADGGSGNILVLAGPSLETLAKIATEPQPRALALSGDGSLLFVTHLPTGRVTIIDTGALKVESVIATLPDANLSLGVVFDEAGRLAYLPQTRSNASNPALLFDSTVFPVVSVVDVAARANAPAKRISLDIADRPVNTPADAALGANGKLYVVNSGSNDLSVVELATGFGVAHVGLGEHPTGLALARDGSALYVNNALSGTVSVVDPASMRILQEVAVTRIPLPRDVLRGKILFHSSGRTEMAKDHWISCASCHFEGEADGRTWAFPDGPRNTPSLLGVKDTAPFHWAGDLDELQDVESTIRRIQSGAGLAPGADNCQPACDQAPHNAGRSQDLDDLAAFMATLELRASPNLTAEGTLTAAAERGRKIFEADAPGCASCHPAPLYTDRRKHDVGTGTSPLERKGSSFDTPSLRGIYKTAPYLHDGSAATLADVLTTRNAGDRHGRTGQLNAAEISDLVEYLGSLPFGTAANCTTGPNTLCRDRPDAFHPLPRGVPPRGR